MILLSNILVSELAVFCGSAPLFYIRMKDCPANSRTTNSIIVVIFHFFLSEDSTTSARSVWITEFSWRRNRCFLQRCLQTYQTPQYSQNIVVLQWNFFETHSSKNEKQRQDRRNETSMVAAISFQIIQYFLASIL